MKRSILFWISFVCAIILAVYFSTRIIMTCMGRGPIGVVHNLSITTDTQDKDLSAIAAAAAIAPGTRTYSINLNAVNTRVGAVPGVRQSAVRRMPNGNIRINTKMYRAVASWTDGDMYFPLADDGTIVQKPTPERGPDTIVFRGELPNDITDITNAAHNMADALDYIEWIENRRWNLITRDGITIMLPEESPVDAIGTLLVLNKNHGILSKSITLIDMRDGARILVK